MSARDDYIAGRLCDRDDEATWRESRAEWEAQRAEDLALDREPVSDREMIDRWAADRAAVESASAEAHERHRQHHPSASALPRYPLEAS